MCYLNEGPWGGSRQTDLYKLGVGRRVRARKKLEIRKRRDPGILDRFGYLSENNVFILLQHNLAKSVFSFGLMWERGWEGMNVDNFGPEIKPTLI